MRALAMLVILVAACGGDQRPDDLAVAPYDYSTPLNADGGVTCGTVQCHAELSEICCIEPSYEYCASSEACSAGIALYCNGPADCSGGVCCQTDTSTVDCVQSCTGTVICQADADCPSSAPSCCGTLGTSTQKTCAATCS